MIPTVISFFAALRAGETGARVIGIVILMALGVIGAGYMIHRHDQRVAAEAIAKIERETIARAKQRISDMEKNNETFRNLSGRDKCLALARDSGLPERACD